MPDTPKRIQLRRTKGWRMPEGAVSVARPTLFGNPFPVDVHGRERAVDLHRRWLTGAISMAELATCSTTVDTSMVHERRRVLDALPTLRGKHLACWCPLDQPCHADALLELANAPLRCEAV